MSRNVLIANVVVFLALVGFCIFVDVITIQYVDDVSRQCKDQDTTKGEIIKIVAIVSIVSTLLLLLLNGALVYRNMKT